VTEYDSGGWIDLLLAIKGDNSWTWLVRETGIPERTFRRWRDGEIPQKANIQIIEQLAEQQKINLFRFKRHPRYWDFDRGYDENLTFEPRLRGAIPTPSATLQRVLLGRPIRSPFGMASGPASSTPGRISAAFTTGGADIVFTKTVRSSKVDPHRQPHFYGGHDQVAVTPDEPARLQVFDLAQDSPAPEVFVNHMGAPSEWPDEWKPQFKAARAHAGSGQLFGINVMGTAKDGDGRAALIDDYGCVVEHALEVHPDAIQVNLSCPNTEGCERQVFRDLSMSTAILRRVAEVTSGTKVIVVVKMGYLSREELRAFVEATATYVDAFEGINTIPVIPVSRAQFSTRPLFAENGEAGASGPAIRKYGLRFTYNLRQILDELGLQKKAILASGGVTKPQHVLEYLQNGADVVLACTNYLFNPTFGLDVRAYLEQNSDLLPSISPNSYTSIVDYNWAAATERFPDHVRANEASFRHMFIVHEAILKRVGNSASGANHRVVLPTVDDIYREIRSRLEQAGLFVS
jgi:dihydroorotate dehydrogenase